MILTPEQLAEIKQIIKDYHDAFIANVLDPDVLPPEVLQRLEKLGLLDPKFESVMTAYKYGQYIGREENQASIRIGYKGFQDEMKKRPIRLSPGEAQAVKIATSQVGQYITNLGGRVTTAVSDAIAEADRDLRVRDIQDAVALNIAKRETAGQLVTDLKHQVKDWTRDWNRIAVTEKQTAMMEGLADHYRSKHGGDSLVAKRPMDDACKYCKKVYLGVDGQPKIFKLSDLEANGTNVGRKANDWLPVVGTIHPHCRCMLIRIPDGWGFDENGDLTPDGELGERYEAETEEDRRELRRALNHDCDLYKGDYAPKRTLLFQDLKIAIETDAGELRHWRTPEGETGTTKMQFPYGYIVGTEGSSSDEDAVDCYIGPERSTDMAFVCEQQNPETGLYDEVKVMLGFHTAEEAKEVYQNHYDRADFLVRIVPMAIDQLKRWLGIEDTKKSDPDGLNYVVKAIVSAEYGAITSPADNRAPNRGAGDVSNYVMGFVKPEPETRVIADYAGYPPLQKFELDKPGVARTIEAVKQTGKRRKEAFYIPQNATFHPRGEITDYQGTVERHQVKERRQWLEEWERRSATWPNRTPVLIERTEKE